MTQEEKRTAFNKRFEIGKAMNEVCDKDVDVLFNRYQNGLERTLDSLVHSAWICGCHYGVAHPELKELDAFKEIEL